LFIDEFLLLLFELLEESLHKVSSGGVYEDELLIFDESLTLVLLYSFISSQYPLSSSFVSFLLINDLLPLLNFPPLIQYNH
jgi:hypothetical protein